MDVLDHTASPQDQAFFDRHLASCTTCSRMFVDAKRGAAFLEMLRNPRPEPPAELFARILARTSGLPDTVEGTSSAPTIAQVPPVSAFATPAAPVAPTPFLYDRPVLGSNDFIGAKVIPFRLRARVERFAHSMLQPRLAMTAAMAFFSIALTLNLTGVHLSALTAQDLKPSSIRKSFFEANAHVVRYCDNLRVVYELEARAHDLRTSSDDSDSAQPSDKPKQDDKPSPDDPKPRPKPGPGTSRREPLYRGDDRMTALLDARSFLQHHNAASFLPVDAGHSGLETNLKGDLA